MSGPDLDAHLTGNGDGYAEDDCLACGEQRSECMCEDRHDEHEIDAYLAERGEW